MLRLDDIRKKGPVNLTPTQRKVLHFLLNHPEKSVFLTASRLAQQIEVSDTSIVRLAQALGYEGFPALQSRLRDLVQSRFTTLDRMGETVRKVEGVEDVLVNVLQRDGANIRKTLEETDREVFRGVVDALDEADRIFVIGLRSAYCLAVFMVSALKFLYRDVSALVPGTGEMWEALRDLDSSDVLVGFSFPRYTRMTVEAVRFARERNAKVLAITDSELSPLAASADWTLPVPYEIDSYMESFTSALSLVNALVTSLAFKRGEDAISALKEMERSWSERGIYWEE